MVDALKSRLNQNQTNSTLGAMDAEMMLLFFVLLLFVFFFFVWFFGFVHLVASSEKKKDFWGLITSANKSLIDPKALIGWFRISILFFTKTNHLTDKWLGKLAFCPYEDKNDCNVIKWSLVDSFHWIGNERNFIEVITVAPLRVFYSKFKCHHCWY